jgi:hypothetical protein
MLLSRSQRTIAYYFTDGHGLHLKLGYGAGNHYITVLLSGSTREGDDKFLETLAEFQKSDRV